MTQANGDKSQKLAAIINTIEILLADMNDISTSSFESTMTSSLVQDVKDARTVVVDKVTILHNKMISAALSSSDNDVISRSGGGGGKS